MACILHHNSQDLFKSMALQMEMDKSEKKILEQQLQKVNDKLEHVHKVLAHKNHIISNLELDLEHLIKQMAKLQSV